MREEDEAWLYRAVQRNAEGMRDCEVFCQLWNDSMLEDPIPILQCGLAVMMNKPFFIVVPPGQHLPENLRRLAREVLVADLSSPVGRQEIAEWMKRVAEAE